MVSEHRVILAREGGRAAGEAVFGGGRSGQQDFSYQWREPETGITIKNDLQGPTSDREATAPKASRSSPNSSGSWGLSVQTGEPVGNLTV